MVDLCKTGSERHWRHQSLFLFVTDALVSPSPAVLLFQVLHQLAYEGILELLTRTHSCLLSGGLSTFGISLWSLVFVFAFRVDLFLKHTCISFWLRVSHIIASAFTLEVCGCHTSVVAGYLTFTDHARHQRLCCLYRFRSRLVHVRTTSCARIFSLRKLLNQRWLLRRWVRCRCETFRISLSITVTHKIIVINFVFHSLAKVRDRSEGTLTNIDLVVAGLTLVSFAVGSEFFADPICWSPCALSARHMLTRYDGLGVRLSRTELQCKVLVLVDLGSLFLCPLHTLLN